MAAGYLAAGVCWPTSSQAIDAYYSALNPAIPSGTTTTYHYQTVKTSGVWYLTKYTMSSTGVKTTNWTSALPTNVTGDCDNVNDPSTNFTDGMQVGWGVAAAILAVYLIRRVQR